MTEERIKHYKKRLMNKMNALIEEIKKDREEFKREYKKTHIKPDGYVLRENLTVFDEELEAVQHFKKWIENQDESKYNEINEFKNVVLKELKRMYEELTRLRAGIRMLMETVKSTFV